MNSFKKVKDSIARREVTKYGAVPSSFYLIRSNSDHDSYSSLWSERSDKQNKSSLDWNSLYGQTWQIFCRGGKPTNTATAIIVCVTGVYMVWEFYPTKMMLVWIHSADIFVYLQCWLNKRMYFVVLVNLSLFELHHRTVIICIITALFRHACWWCTLFVNCFNTHHFISTHYQ